MQTMARPPLAPPPLASRSAVVVVLLSLAVIATAALSWEAVSGARQARATAERVLRDYAGFAAAQFVREAEIRLEGRASSILSAVRHKVEGHPTDGRMLRQGADDCDCPATERVQTTFAVSRQGPVVVEGQPLASDLIATLAAAVTEQPRSRASMHLLDAGLAVSAGGRAGGEPVMLGAVVAEELLSEVFDRAVRQTALLPSTLMAADAARSLLVIKVIDARGRERFAWNQEASPFTATLAMAPRFGGLTVEAAIPARAASELVIGGLPTDRWPVAVGLLVLALGLFAAAAMQLRREVRFARQRADFVSGVSHELRTPLAQIRLFGETLLLGRVRSRDEERRAAEIIVQEARRLSQMVDNVLLFSRAGRGPASVARAPVQPAALVGDVVDMFRPQALSKDVTMLFTSTGPSTERLLDRNIVRQVLVNLLDNAVKYGPRGQRVRVDVASAADRVTIMVTDEGPGIAADDRRRIWDPFWRAAGSAEGGTGLGLAIVRELVRQHGGTVDVDSGPEGGARFVVDLLAPAAASAADRRADRAPQPA